jgi:hypothetical protein
VPTALGLGALAVLFTGIGAAVVHDDAGTVQAARVITRPVAAPAVTPAATTPPAVSPVRHHHARPNVLGEQRHRAAHRGHPAQPVGSDVLPFTGPVPLAPSLALGLLLLIAGMWLLAGAPPATTIGAALRYDAARGLSALARSSVTERSPRSDGAIARLRSPGHQL